VSTERGEIVITDNGPGLPSPTLGSVLDYTVRVSSREAYVSPSRGQQGNGLKCIIAMPFALDGTHGTTVIESQGRRIGLCSRWIQCGVNQGSCAR
jgi:DNA topoisomerase VI subunit B